VDIRKYLEIFSREAEELLAVLRQGLVALEQDGFAPERIHALLRAAHTLKGSARLLNLEVLAEVAHRMEGVLKELEGGERPLESSLIDLLLVSTDAIEALVAQAHSGGEIGVDVGAVLAGLESGVLPTSGEFPAAAPAPERGGPLDSVRTSVDRLDRIINLLSEILMVRGIFEERGREFSRLLGRLDGFLRRLRKAENYSFLKEIRDAFSRFGHDLEGDTGGLQHLAEELHGAAMELRMLPLSTITDELGRMVRDLAREQGKEVSLQISGEEVELDRMLLEAVRPMFLHLLRNAVDHGIEAPAERKRAGKPPGGRIELVARYEEGFVRVSLRDDGAGIDPGHIRRVATERRLISAEEAGCLSDDEALHLVLRPGFSTREIITDVSGRGVGLDVVKTGIDRIKGTLRITSDPGRGTEIALQFPLTLALTKGMVFECERETYVLPLHSVTEVLRLGEADVLSEGGREVVRVRGGLLPLVDLAAILASPRRAPPSSGFLSALVLESRGRKLAFLVSRALGAQDLVIKGLGPQLRHLELFSGGTILGDGSPALILAVPELFTASLATAGTELRLHFESQKGEATRGRILVVDDSITTRTMEKNILETHGYQVTLAVSGDEALARVAAADFDLVVTDIEMPGMNGFELTRRLKERERTREIPVVIVTSLASDEDRRKGIEVGAEAYIVKRSFDQGTLLQTVETLIG
jgi:two-component system chemotaxis sensor kinase CheA